MPIRTGALLAGLAALAIAAGDPAERQQLAQFGDPGKIRATPVPRRTATPGTQQNIERRGAPSQPGQPFGKMHK